MKIRNKKKLEKLGINPSYEKLTAKSNYVLDNLENNCQVCVLILGQTEHKKNPTECPVQF